MASSSEPPDLSKVISFESRKEDKKRADEGVTFTMRLGGVVSNLDKLDVLIEQFIECGFLVDDVYIHIESGVAEKDAVANDI